MLAGCNSGTAHHRGMSVGMHMEILADKSLWGGIGGWVTSVTLAQWSHIAGITAGAATTIFMIIRIVQVLRRGKDEVR